MLNIFGFFSYQNQSPGDCITTWEMLEKRGSCTPVLEFVFRNYVLPETGETQFLTSNTGGNSNSKTA